MSLARKRRCPPSVRIAGIFPARAQRVTVLGFTRNHSATSEGVRRASSSRTSIDFPHRSGADALDSIGSVCEEHRFGTKHRKDSERLPSPASAPTCEHSGGCPRRRHQVSRTHEAFGRDFTPTVAKPALVRRRESRDLPTMKRRVTPLSPNAGSETRYRGVQARISARRALALSRPPSTDRS